jgi:uncharacterized protein
MGGRPAVTFTQECTIPVTRERLWAFMMEVPNVARCVPGVEAVEAVDAGAYRGRYRGRFNIQVGLIRLALEGTVTVEAQDQDAWQARMRAEANDRRLGGGIRARLGLALAPVEGGTHLKIETDLAVLGRIGEFGQPIIKKKADALLAEFARNLQSALAA